MKLNLVQFKVEFKWMPTTYPPSFAMQSLKMVCFLNDCQGYQRRIPIGIWPVIVLLCEKIEQR